MRTKFLNFRYENSAGNNFELPDKCRGKHPGQAKNFNCSLINHSDVIAFRQQLYQTNEKRDQEIFLLNFLKICNPKRSKSCKRMVTVTYFIPKISGEELQVCRQMFETVSAKPASHVSNAVNRISKREILNGTLLQAGKRKILDNITSKQEKLLALEKGSLNSFVKAIAGKDMVEIEDTEELNSGQELLYNIIEDTRTTSYKKKRINLIVEEEEVPVNYLNLTNFETCRICLENRESLVNIFRNAEENQQTVADLVEFCLPIQVKPGDGFPQKICKDCVKQVQVACYLKKNCLDSLKIMESIAGEKSLFKIPGNSEALDVCEFSNFVANERTRVVVTEDEDFMVEEYLIEDETPAENEVLMEIEATADQVVEEEVEEESTEKERSLKLHAVIADPSMRPRKCYLCDVDFEITPEDHFSSAHPLIDYSLRCTKCEFDTDFPWFLNLHYQVHEDVFNLCPFCGKRFELYEWAKFSKHKNNCNPVTKERRQKILECEVCGAHFRDQSAFRDHYRKKHTKEVRFL